MIETSPSRSETETHTIESRRMEPARRWVAPRLRELWRYRELVYYLAWRDIKVRYKQTVLGAAWAILQPFLLMVVFSVFFNRMAGIGPSDDIPYPVWSYAALVPWTFFANSLTQASSSLVTNANMLKKIYFPRLTLPLSAVLAGGVDFILAFVVLLAMMAVYGLSPTVGIVWLPLFFLLLVATALGASLWLAALNIQFRDVRYTVPFLVQTLMFVSPIIYSSEELEQPWRTLYGINPIAGVVEGFRWALLGTEPSPGPMLLLSICVALAMLVSGGFYFQRLEQHFADVA